MSAQIINFADLKRQQATTRAEQQALNNMSINQLAQSMQRMFEAVEENPTVKGQPEPVEISAARLKNFYCEIELRSDKEVFGRDLKDHYNDPAFYNKTSRGLKKAWKALTDSFDEGMRMREAMAILEQNKIRCRSYCMMD